QNALHGNLRGMTITAFHSVRVHRESRGASGTGRSIRPARSSPVAAGTLGNALRKGGRAGAVPPGVRERNCLAAGGLRGWRGVTHVPAAFRQVQHLPKGWTVRFSAGPAAPIRAAVLPRIA